MGLTPCCGPRFHVRCPSRYRQAALRNVNSGVEHASSTPNTSAAWGKLQRWPGACAGEPQAPPSGGVRAATALAGRRIGVLRHMDTGVRVPAARAGRVRADKVLAVEFGSKASEGTRAETSAPRSEHRPVEEARARTASAAKGRGPV